MTVPSTRTSARRGRPGRPSPGSARPPPCRGRPALRVVLHAACRALAACCTSPRCTRMLQYIMRGSRGMPLPVCIASCSVSHANAVSSLTAHAARHVTRVRIGTNHLRSTRRCVRLWHVAHGTHIRVRRAFAHAATTLTRSMPSRCIGVHVCLVCIAQCCTPSRARPDGPTSSHAARIVARSDAECARSKCRRFRADMNSCNCKPALRLVTNEYHAVTFMPPVETKSPNIVVTRTRPRARASTPQVRATSTHTYPLTSCLPKRPAQSNARCDSIGCQCVRTE